MEFQKYFLPDDSLPTDKFVLSLFDIFDSYVPINEKELRRYLDKKGYYGRSKIKEIRKRGNGTDLFRLEIYLPNSLIAYDWPIFTNFTFDDFDKVYKAHKKLPSCLSEVFRAATAVPIATHMTVSKYGIIAKPGHIPYAIDILHKLGLLRGNRNTIKDKEDIKEISANLIKPKMFL